MVLATMAGACAGMTFRGILRSESRGRSLLGLVAVLFAATTQPLASQQVSLEIATSYPLAPGQRLAGLSAVDDSLFAYWLRGAPGITLVHHSTPLEVGTSVVIRPVGVRLAHDRVVVLDAAKQQCLTFDFRGDLLDRVRFTVLGIIEAAAPARDGWYLGVRKPDRSFALAFLDSAGVREIKAFGAGDTLEIYTAHLRADGDNAILAQVAAPFTILSITRDGRTRPIPDLRPDTLNVLTEPGRRWIALAPIHVEQGWVQMFADLTSDARVAITSPGRASVRAQFFNVPFGLGWRSGTLLWGTRLTDREEIVAYRWRWVGGP